MPNAARAERSGPALGQHTPALELDGPGAGAVGTERCLFPAAERGVVCPPRQDLISRKSGAEERGLPPKIQRVAYFSPWLYHHPVSVGAIEVSYGRACFEEVGLCR
ncbi:unnamed protein product [Prorocentrum cordatum]|uniref:Uncharacterized protein n=1 Tax=Prorocentrum cordatum TaxID=2364126 RepID=A0ABN9TFM9_9DINO|nr:unnamed protein product [Polarella glacialis]